MRAFAPGSCVRDHLQSFTGILREDHGNPWGCWLLWLNESEKRGWGASRKRMTIMCKTDRREGKVYFAVWKIALVEGSSDHYGLDLLIRQEGARPLERRLRNSSIDRDQPLPALTVHQPSPMFVTHVFMNL